MPERVRAPGMFASYSNYGTTLAGYIVQQVSGMPFEDYVEKNIYGALGMDHSTFRQPPEEGVRALLSEGYYSGSTFRRGDPEYMQVGPCWNHGIVSH